MYVKMYSMTNYKCNHLSPLKSSQQEHVNASLYENSRVSFLSCNASGTWKQVRTILWLWYWTRKNVLALPFSSFNTILCNLEPRFRACRVAQMVRVPIKQASGPEFRTPVLQKTKKNCWLPLESLYRNKWHKNTYFIHHCEHPGYCTIVSEIKYYIVLKIWGYFFLNTSKTDDRVSLLSSRSIDSWCS
jgi:hypothetical protein